MAERLVDMPEYQKLSNKELDIITRRVMEVYSKHRHPERAREVSKIIDQIKRELRAGHRVH